MPSNIIADASVAKCGGSRGPIPYCCPRTKPKYPEVSRRALDYRRDLSRLYRRVRLPRHVFAPTLRLRPILRKHADWRRKLLKRNLKVSHRRLWSITPCRSWHLLYQRLTDLSLKNLVCRMYFLAAFCIRYNSMYSQAIPIRNLQSPPLLQLLFTRYSQIY